MKIFWPMIAMAAAAPVVHAADQPQGWSADHIPWQTQGIQGTRFALLEGVRDQPRVAFSYAFFIPAGVWDGPHSHSATARVFVAKGGLKIGYGASFDPAKLRTYAAGSYVIVPAGIVHFDGADIDTVIIGTAIGPWSTRYVDGSAPASAGTPISPSAPASVSNSAPARRSPD